MGLVIGFEFEFEFEFEFSASGRLPDSEGNGKRDAQSGDDTAGRDGGG
ncbi:MAG: hypothetical protein LBO82_01340 [Synergistaceae bacterium]|nr:hypothetical protein [Synergistaceae bacterium]